MTEQILATGHIRLPRMSCARMLHVVAEELAITAGELGADGGEFYADLCTDVLGLIAKLEQRQKELETPPLGVAEDGPQHYKTNGVYTP